MISIVVSKPEVYFQATHFLPEITHVFFFLGGFTNIMEMQSQNVVSRPFQKV